MTENPQREGDGGVPSYEETVRRLLQTPKDEAARLGLDTDDIVTFLTREERRPLLFDLAPRTEQPEAADAERLLTAEAERSGVTVAALVDDLCRAARRHPPLGLDPQPGAAVRNQRRGGVAKTTAAFELPESARAAAGPGPCGAAVFGTPGRGKRAAADLLRQELDAHGARYRERDVTRDGVSYVEFDVEAPGTGKESR